MWYLSLSYSPRPDRQTEEESSESRRYAACVSAPRFSFLLFPAPRRSKAIHPSLHPSVYPTLAITTATHLPQQIREKKKRLKPWPGRLRSPDYMYPPTPPFNLNHESPTTASTCQTSSSWSTPSPPGSTPPAPTPAPAPPKTPSSAAQTSHHRQQKSSWRR